MDDSTKAKLATNISNSWKMASNVWYGVVGALAVAYTQMPPEMQQSILGHIPVPPWALPVITYLIGYALRVMPQKAITPTVAAAKSADAP